MTPCVSMMLVLAHRAWQHLQCTASEGTVSPESAILVGM